MHAPQSAPPEEPPELLCGTCNYDLRGIPQTSDRCPECGTQFDRAHLLGHLVPWERRKAVGRFKAFFQTIWWGTVRIGALAEKSDRPVSYRDARRFRWIMMFLASGGLAAGLIWWYAEANINEPRYYDRQLRPDEMMWLLALNPWSFGVLVMSLMLWTNACIASVTALFYSTRLGENQQKRAIALSCYTSAVFAWLPPAVPLAAMIIMIAGAGSTFMNPFPLVGNTILMLCWLAFVAQAFSWLRWRSDRPVTRTGRKRLLIALLTGAIMTVGYIMVWQRWDGWYSPVRLIGWSVSVSALAAILMGTLLLGFWFNTLRLMRRLLHPSWGKTAVAGAALFVAWLALGILIVGTIEAAWVMMQVVMAAGT